MGNGNCNEGAIWRNFELHSVVAERCHNVRVEKKNSVPSFVVNTNQYNWVDLLLSQTINGKWNGWDGGERPSLLEKNELWAERKISNYPHLCSTTWEGWDEAISCLSTGTTKSLYASVSYFPFWHHPSSRLSRHDHIWQVPRTLAKLDKKEAVICGGGGGVVGGLPACLWGTWAGCVA